MNIISYNNYQIYINNSRIVGILKINNNKLKHCRLSEVRFIIDKFYNQYNLFSEDNIDKDIINGKNKLIGSLTFFNTVLLSTILIFGIKLYGDNNVQYKLLSADEGKKTIKSVNASTKDLKRALSSNKLIDKKIKKNINSFIDYLEEYYPDTNLDKFYYNLRDLNICYKDEIKTLKKDSNVTVKGNYNVIDNKIEILNNLDSTTSKSVLYHELVHVCTNCNYDNNIIKYNGEAGIGAEEMFCEYFSSRQLEIVSTGYSWLPYAECIVVLTNYTFDDYCNGGIELLEERLDDNGLNGSEIIDYLDALRNDIMFINDDEKMNDYSINYSEELQDICYRKVIDKFSSSSFDTMYDYIEYISSEVIPGISKDFNSWVNNNLSYEELELEKINSNYFKDSIKKNVLFDMDMINIGEVINLDEYNIEKIENTNKWILTNEDFLIYNSIDSVDKYKDYLNNPLEYNEQDRDSLYKKASLKGKKLFKNYTNDISNVLEKDFKNKHHINNKIDLVCDNTDGMYFSSNGHNINISKYEDLSIEDNVYNLYFILQCNINSNIFNNNFYNCYNSIHNKIDEIDPYALKDYPIYNFDNEKVFNK